jgi:hypothetical protein
VNEPAVDTSPQRQQRPADPTNDVAPSLVPAPVGPSGFGPGPPTSPEAVMALQRGAGNAAVSRLLAGGGAQRPATLARQQKEDPPQLPITGDAHFMLLDQERHFPLDLPDLDEFGIGKGELSTGPIDLGEGVSVQLDVGAHNPPRLADASIHLSPVEAYVAGSLIAERREAAKIGGYEGAVVGGVLGGIGGLFKGSPLKGAEEGGLEGGKAGEAAAGWYLDKFALEAKLLSGTLSGHLRLLYSPYIRLRVGLSIFEKALSADAKLQTQIGLSLVPRLSVAGSGVALHFEKGKLARSEFALELEAGIEAALDVTGMLQLGLTILNIIDNDSSESEKHQAHDDPGLLSINLLETDVFPIVEDLRGDFKANTKLDFLKASPLDLIKKRYSAKNDPVTALVTKGLKQDLGPAVKKDRAKQPKRAPEKAAEGGGGAGDPPHLRGGRRWHKGTYQDPVPIIWFKPPHIYPGHLPHRGGDDVAKFPHRTYGDGLEAGVDGEFWSWPKKKFKKVSGKRANDENTVGQAELAADFEEHHVDWKQGEEREIDHVLDDFFGGPDLAWNLWPLNATANRQAGNKQPNQGVRQHDDPATPPPLPKPLWSIGTDKWLVITEELEPSAGIPLEGAPELE